MEKSEFLKTGLEAAKKAEEIILKYYSDEIRAELKEDMSPVTVADREAEKAIIEIIRLKFPDHSILGEESGSSDSASEYLWIIDPIDGTKNYMRKIPLFATQIALMKDGEVIVGVSNAPALKELLYAEKGKGAYCNDRQIHVSKIDMLNKSYMSFGGLRHFEKKNLVDNLLVLVNSTQGHRGIGDFWSYHLLAQGKIEIMIEADTKIWDIAALSIIVREAGGKVTDIKGGTVGKETTSIIATNEIVHDEVLGILGK